MQVQVEMEDHFVHKRFKKEIKRRSKSPQMTVSDDSGVSEEDNDHHEHTLAEKLREGIDHFVGLFRETPSWLRDNRYIKSGYRVNFNTPKKVLKSLFMIHNEFVNIWTHLGGALLVIIVAFTLYSQYFSSDNVTEKGYVVSKMNDYFAPLYKDIAQFENIEQVCNVIKHSETNPQ